MAEALKTRRGTARRPRGARSAPKADEAVTLASYIQASLDVKLASERAVTRCGRGRGCNRRSKTKAQQQERAEGDVGDATALCRTVIAVNMGDKEKLQDVETDLRAFFERFGVVESLHLCQTTAEVTLVFMTAVEAKAAVLATNGTRFCGRPVTARLQSELVEDKAPVNAAKMGSVDPPPLVRDEKKQIERTRKRRSKAKNAVVKSRETLHHEGANTQAEIAAESRTFCVRNLVEAEELQDDEYEEIQGELTADFSRFGDLVEVVVVRHQDSEKGGRQGVLVGDVVATYQEEASAVAAFLAFNGKTFGGRTVTCFWGPDKVTRDTTVVIEGMLTPEELEDPDEFVDVQEETLQVCSRYGQVNDLKLCKSTGSVTVTFNESRDANELVRTLNGSQYGGRLLAVRLANVAVEIDDSAGLPPQEEAKHASPPIIQPTESSEMQDLIVAFLKRLAALQERSHIQNPRHDKRSQRLVLGMHEVRRGLLSRKIQMLLLATDLEACDALTDTIAELVAIAREQEVPVFAPMNRRKLGRVVKKSVRVSCIGVYSVEGANELFQQILQASKRCVDLM